MKILKLAIISAVFLFLLLTAFSLLLPSRITISRAIDINGSPAPIRAEIEDLRHWRQWNTYVMPFPDANFQRRKIASGKLSVYLNSYQGELIKTTWQQQSKSFPGVFRIIPQSAQTTVQWYFEFTFKWYPWEKFGSIIYDKQLGPEMQKSLVNLKELIEKAP